MYHGNYGIIDTIYRKNFAFLQLHTRVKLFVNTNIEHASSRMQRQVVIVTQIARFDGLTSLMQKML